MFLAPNAAQIVLWIHVLAACVWIGGQITLGMLVPVLRGQPALLALAARRYQYVAWTAFLILILTGLANVHNAGITDLTGTPRGRTLGFKLILVAISGVCAGVHAFVVAPRAGAGGGRTSRMLSAVLGAGSLVTAVAAAFYGVDIAEH